MNNIIVSIRNWGVGTKLALAIFLLVGTLYTAFTIAIGYSNTELMEVQSLAAVKAQTRIVADMIEVADNTTSKQAGRSAKSLRNYFPGEFTLDTRAMIDVGGTRTPTLKNADTTLNLDFSVVDKFAGQTGDTATIFVKSAGDFIQVSTSVKTENGRPVGTILDPNHPGYTQLITGTPYVGPAVLMGKQFMTRYDPIKDTAGNVIGLLYVGFDISNELNALKDRIKSIKIGETGYFFVVNAKQGQDYGMTVVHPKIEGQNIY